MNKSTFEEQLAQNGKLIYTNVGDSMMPLCIDVTAVNMSCIEF